MAPLIFDNITYEHGNSRLTQGEGGSAFDARSPQAQTQTRGWGS